eukprot:1552274-Pleurochrysis_carterae.AAC.1
MHIATCACIPHRRVATGVLRRVSVRTDLSKLHFRATDRACVVACASVSHEAGEGVENEARKYTKTHVEVRRPGRRERREDGETLAARSAAALTALREAQSCGEPSAHLFCAAVSAVASEKGRLREAIELLSEMEAWVLLGRKSATTERSAAEAAVVTGR